MPQQSNQLAHSIEGDIPHPAEGGQTQMNKPESKLRKFTAPTYFTKLPSSSPQSKKIRFRPFVTGEQKTLLLAQETGDEEVTFEAIKDVCDACVLDPINFEDLTVYDAEYLFLQIRCKAVGETVETKLKCPKCDHSNVVVLDLSTPVLSSELKIEPITIADGRHLTFTHPKMKSLRLTFGSSSSPSSDNASVAVQTYLRMADSMVSVQDGDELLVQGTDYQIEEAIDLLDSLTPKDFEKIEEFFNNVPVLVLKTSMTCTECGETSPVELSGIQNFFD